MRFTILAFLALAALVAAWTKEDHEIFRLKDELEQHENPGMTFYEFLAISPSATQEEIGKAYRKKSKLLHPDKAKQSFLASHSKAARSASKTQSGAGKPAKPTAVKPPSQREINAAVKTASERFTRLGLIHRILTGEGRARYDHFLANGFPTWRGADYYYARFRPGLGSVLLGLFLFAGGAVHYGVLVLGHKRRRDFVERYIRQARTLAWGDASSTAGIPGIDTAGAAVAASSGADPEQEERVQPMNRRERRAQEKESKKPTAAARRAARRGGNGNGSGSGTSTPRGGDEAGAAVGPVGSPVAGPKKRVQAENGKVLVVDSAGNVFLEEEDEEGNTELFLLDPNEVEPPSFSQTVVVRLPIWIWGAAKAKILGGGAVSGLPTGGESKKAGGKSETVEEIDGFVNVQDEDAYEKNAPPSEGKKKKKGKK